MLKRLAVVGVLSSQWKDAIHFYHDTLGIPVQFRWPRQHWIELGFAPTPPTLSPFPLHWSFKKDPRPGTSILCFVTDNLSADYELLRSRGLKVLAEPYREDWGAMEAVFEGLDSIEIYIGEIPKQKPDALSENEWQQYLHYIRSH